jgi:hypothetical protein
MPMKKKSTQNNTTNCPECGHKINIEPLYSKIRKEIENDVELRMKEKDLLITQLAEQSMNMHKTASQRSMELQGEAKEVLIEEWLIAHFPLDSITPVKKGAKGADCLQQINTRTNINVGSIYYESKSTKVFQPAWIDKFKEDMRAKNATAGILVTDVFPKDKERLFQVDNVWVCSLDEFKSLCFVVRAFIIIIGEAIEFQDNRSDKANLLLDYIISQEFRGQAEGVIENFVDMQMQLEAERRSFEAQWKRREQSIRKALLHTTHMFSSIKAIVGNSLANVALLELAQPKDTNDGA